MDGEALASEAGADLPEDGWRAGDEPLEGYRLVEPLGKGGFGVVWKCAAPGGFLKAIKFVQGASSVADDSQASLAEQERRAIELIKNVRHPFILTVERAELRRGALIVVTELADRSLADLFEECVARGLPGIPRDELLGYLAEAAEALDEMNFQHGLQHLDVKPHNLFLIAGHVKVADFGLVNRLPDPRAVEAGAAGTSRGAGAHGVTPRYMAPEILKQRISRRSDQYSLAIVYQELLVGQLPFKGRNNRQLILQHAQAPPDLAPLPEGDRDVVARALAKEPDDRFPSCRDFVRALVHGSVPNGVTPARRTDPAVKVPAGVVSLDGYAYEQIIQQTPLGEVWQVRSPHGEVSWAYHLQGFAVDDPAAQQEALAYLQSVRHPAVMRFRVGEVAPHRITLLFEPWGPSLGERARAQVLGPGDLLPALAEAARALDDLAARTNLEHLGVNPEVIVRGLDGEQLRDFGLIARLWRRGPRPLDSLNARYAAPELAQGRPRPASDQYSLAAVYADLRTLELTGRMGAPHRTPGKGRPAGVELDALTAAERQVLAQALDVDPDKRFASCVALVEALAEARGGAPGAMTTAAHSALGTTQESFLVALDDWINRQEATATHMPPPPAADAAPHDVGITDIVPGTVALRLELFRQECQAQAVDAGPDTFRYFRSLEPTFWQRLRGQEVGADVEVTLRPIDPAAPKRCRVAVAIRPRNCNAAQVTQVRTALAPAMQQSIARCLSAQAERRGNARLPCRAGITVRHRAPGCRPTELAGEVVDISRRGIGIVTPGAVERGEEIRVLMGLPQPGESPLVVWLRAVVRRCSARLGGQFELGAEFVRETPRQEG